MSDEHWRPVFGYEGQYEVSIIGRVRSLVAKDAPLIMKQNIRKDGYLQVQLKVNQKPNNQLVHRIVDKAFNGEMVEGLEVNHIDGDKTNNRLSNIERVTRKENVRHAWDTGLCNARTGDKNHATKISDETVRAIRAEKIERGEKRIKRGTLIAIMNKYGVSRSQLCRIINNKARHTK